MSGFSCASPVRLPQTLITSTTLAKVPNAAGTLRVPSSHPPLRRDEAHSAVFVSILMRGHTRKMMAEMMP